MILTLPYTGLKVLDWDEFLALPGLEIDNKQIYYRGIILSQSVNFSEKYRNAALAYTKEYLKDGRLSFAVARGGIITIWRTMFFPALISPRITKPPRPKASRLLRMSACLEEPNLKQEQDSKPSKLTKQYRGISY